MASLRQMSLKLLTSKMRAFRIRFKSEDKSKNFQELIVSTSTDNLNETILSKARAFIQKSSQKYKNWLKVSRYSGLPFALLYGIFLFLYLNYLIVPRRHLNNSSQIKKPNISISCSRSARYNNILENITNIKTKDDKEHSHRIVNTFTFFNFTANHTSENTTSNPPSNLSGTQAKQSIWKTGSAFSLYSAVLLTFSIGTISFFSKHTRCMMTLVLPGLITGRGRSILMTLVIGILVDGPVNSINYNINQVVESNACMYESMKGMACSSASQMEKIMEQASLIIDEQGQRMYNEMESITKNIKSLTDKAKMELQLKEQQLKTRMIDLRKKTESLRQFSRDLAKPCEWSNSVLSGARDIFKDIGEAVVNTWPGSNARRHRVDWQWYTSDRKRRDVVQCESIIQFPDLSKLHDGLDLKSVRKLKTWAQDLVPDLDFNLFEKMNLESLVKAPSITGIREKIITTVSTIFNILKTHLQLVKKGIMLISMLLLIYLSYKYLQDYYSDDSFDNKFIDDNIRNLWQNCDYPKLTPLRNWELNAHYQVSASPKLSKMELRNALLRMLPSFLVCVVAIITLLGDYALAALLSGLATHGKFAITFEGMEQGFSFTESMLKSRNATGGDQEFLMTLEKVDLSSDPCLPRPIFTPKTDIISVLVLIVFMALSCFFDAYFSRVRAQICNLFYEERAKERAEYLYDQLKSGRTIRRIRFQTIILKELKRRRRLKEFSRFWNIFKKLWHNVHPSKYVICPGCMKDTKINDTKSLSVDVSEPKALICSNCALDF